MNDKPHSRNQPSGGHGARSGADRLRAAARDAQQQEPIQPNGDAQDEATQAFAGTGQFTGRPVAPQEGAPVPPPQTPHELQQQQQYAAHQQQAGAPPPPPGDDVQLLARERDELREHLQRMAADFDNFRKRSQRERESAASAADAKLLGELLVVLDDLERALSHVPPAEAGADGSVAEGIRMVQGRLRNVLESHGLTEIESDGQFDPHLHEAVMMRPPQAGEHEGQILDVAQKGYRLGDRVLRHSKVVVAGD